VEGRSRSSSQMSVGGTPGSEWLALGVALRSKAERGGGES